MADPLTLESRQSNVLAPETLHKLDAVHNDWSTQNVGEGKDVDLLQRGSWEQGQGQHLGLDVVNTNYEYICFR